MVIYACCNVKHFLVLVENLYAISQVLWVNLPIKITG